ncbi:hypothetical protein HNQ50_001443 [Silvimonas terrae]|uniref:Uncharacterized protein n=1 Tax=Silvimonas terrae TaxID=300266 RepID=A0A840REN9_9NEIS|nr:hypothetical protein [Silvimonas terrae]MBB5190721.1 hypothetical protein [Silvimonas terrae]
MLEWLRDLFGIGDDEGETEYDEGYSDGFADGSEERERWDQD